jgi:Arc/MetJ-type ribon-helix-helix transcriptional regulator
MAEYTILVTTKFKEDTIKRIDALIQKEKFSSRASIIRRAVSEFLEKEDKPIRA